jgi:arginine/ornithine N-succinyltransferase beta subunit
MKRNLLFVTYKDGEIEEGLNYALDLAKMTDKGMAVLLVNKKKLSRKLEDIMSAVAFAEENEQTMAQEIMLESQEQEVQTAIEAKCKNLGIAAAVHTAFQDAATSLKDFLRQNSSIDMVLLSPTITENGNISSRELSRLVKTASRPIVTMAKQPHTA